jgi:hypothetical protein
VYNPFLPYNNRLIRSLSAYQHERIKYPRLSGSGVQPLKLLLFSFFSAKPGVWLKGDHQSSYFSFAGDNKVPETQWIWSTATKASFFFVSFFFLAFIQDKHNLQNSAKPGVWLKGDHQSSYFSFAQSTVYNIIQCGITNFHLIISC